MTLVPDNVLYWVIVVAVSMVILYFVPFLISVWLRPLMLLWGFVLGRRRRNALLSPQYNVQQASASAGGPGSYIPTPSNNPQTAVSDVLKNESDYVDDMHKKRIDSFEKRLKSIQDKLELKDKEYEKLRKEAKDNFIGKPFYECLHKLNNVTAKDFLLLILIMAFLTVDTLIAQQVFTSLGLFPTDKYSIFGKEISFTFIGGLFLTSAVTFFLDIAWDRNKLQGFLKDKKAGIFLGLLTLLIFFVLRFVTVAFPPYAKPVIELLMLLGWVLGVLAVWWLLGEILGPNHNWFDVFIALCTPIILILVVVFGALFLVEKVLETVMKAMAKTWFHLRIARITRQEQNTEVAYDATKRGFYRGLTI